MILPAELQFALTTFVTGGAGVAWVIPIVAAPGAGNRLRLWAASSHIVYNSPAGICDAHLHNAGGAFVWLSGLDAGARDSKGWIPGGIRLTTNTALWGTVTPSVANMIVNMAAYYTVEAV